jgi:protease IV
MRSFFKIFFATLLALIALFVIGIFILVRLVSSAVSSEKATISSNSVLVLETSQPYSEQPELPNALKMVQGADSKGNPGLFDVVRLIEHAATDENIKGIYIKAEGNANGFATNEEVRNALLKFKKSGKFIYAYGEVIAQQSYYLVSLADKIYLHPKGELEFGGFYQQLQFLKGTLEKLEIQPQIFYDGRFKSATEPLRETEMTVANRIQTNAYLGDLYANFLQGIGTARKIDTALLHSYANQGLIQNADAAAKYKLVDALKYDDEVMKELDAKLGLQEDDKISFVSLSKYDEATDISDHDGDAKIALIYAAGSITGGDSEKSDNISSEYYLHLIRKAREDKSIKAVVFRVNSPGGSALASETIWRELELTKKVKPVVVSMGDYAASGGYYISCMADTIFAQPNTLTGSIGVFAVLPNLSSFFKNKLGVTFDGVKTAQYADLGTMSRPLTDEEKQFMQNSVDSIYSSFKGRVVAGRKLQGLLVDSIAQGRVWSGVQAKQLGLVDKIGGINDAIACAARMTHAASFRLVELPEQKENRFQAIVNAIAGGDDDSRETAIKAELGVQNYMLYKQIKQLQEMNGQVEARLPYDLIIK